MLCIFTDGSTLKNGSKDARGGFGVVVTDNNRVINAHSHFCEGTTNNREEMKAIIWALSNYGNSVPPPIVYSDSSYCVNTFNQWMNSWKRNGWIKSDKKVPENLDLIKLYDIIKEQGKKIDLRYVKGHAGFTFNELADALATGRMSVEEVLKRGY